MFSPEPQYYMEYKLLQRKHDVKSVPDIHLYLSLLHPIDSITTS